MNKSNAKEICAAEQTNYEITAKEGVLMLYEKFGNGVVLSDYDSFDIRDTLECGQVFRFEKTGEREYFLIAGERGISIKQERDTTFFTPCSVSEFENVWLDYFDLKRDYMKIKNTLSDGDEVMKRACGFGAGLRILNQDRAEMLISFIISQNKHISGIKKILWALCEKYGRFTENEYGGYYTFPDAETLSKLSAADFAELKTGFRAGYLADAVKKVYTGEISLYPPDGKPAAEIMDDLMKIRGVGPKVANCVLLFSFGARERFPVDVWVKRAVKDLYFQGKDISLKEIENWAAAKFGGYGGYAQQYLFYYMRSAAASL